MDDTRARRFPYIAAAICAVCVGAAGWTWMQYSYASAFTGAQLAEAYDPASASAHGLSMVVASGRTRRPGPDYLSSWGHPGLIDRYVAVQDRVQGTWSFGSLTGMSLPVADTYVVLLVTPPDGPKLPSTGGPVSLSGRIVCLSRWVEGGDSLVLDTTASRFAWQSVTGLAAGASGIGVFAFFLVKWLAHRRRSESGAGTRDSGV